MTETNEGRQIVPLQPRQPMGIIPQNYTEIIQLGGILAASGYFADTKTEAQAVAKIIAGAEAGFGPMASLTGIHIVQGKPTFGANLMASAVKSSGRYAYKIKQLDDTACILEFYERGQKLGESSFTLEDAKKAKLTGKDIWTSYARNMLFARAMSNGVRWYCPDVFGGVTAYTPEELGANVIITDAGDEIIQAETSNSAAKPQAAASPSHLIPTKSENGEAKKITPRHVIATKAWRDKYDQLWDQAQNLGVSPMPAPVSGREDATEIEIDQGAKALKALINTCLAEVEPKDGGAEEMLREAGV